MLLVAESMGKLSFSQLMEVYREGNLEKARNFWPDLLEGQSLLQAEQEFYQYLQEVFFSSSQAVYCIWVEDGRYISALRLEAYEDGLLMEALETDPAFRNRGYAGKLLLAVLYQFGDRRIYSHVSKKNAPSLAVHTKCGFRRIKEYASYLDGSINSRGCTLVYEKEKAHH